MKFVLEKLNHSRGRTGKLLKLKSNPDVEYKTPLCIITTSLGSAPHLTPVSSISLFL